MRGLAVALSLFAVGLCGTARAQESPFKDWAVLLVAADYVTSTGADTDIFDNARQDLGKALVGAGFSPQNMLHVSTRATRYDNPKPIGTEPPLAFATTWNQLAAKAKAGCFVFITSHGGPEGIRFGMLTRDAQNLGKLVTDACGERPTVAIISACYSGIFVPTLSGPNRMVMTAARHDRSSFGCGGDERYTYFDACLIEAMSRVKGLAGLPPDVRQCVESKEASLNVVPAAQASLYLQPPAGILLASEPQTTIGETFGAAIERYVFRPPARATAGAGSAQRSR